MIRCDLFVTCIVDQLFPEVGVSVVRVLRGLGVEVGFPEGQTCCGQAVFNMGFRREAREMARRVLEEFEGSEYVVVPSGSCAAMMRVFYPELLEGDVELLPKAEAMAGKTYEFSEFLVEVAGVGVSGGGQDEQDFEGDALQVPAFAGMTGGGGNDDSYSTAGPSTLTGRTLRGSPESGLTGRRLFEGTNPAGFAGEGGVSPESGSSGLRWGQAKGRERERTAVFHPGCHLLREMGVRDAPQSLLRGIEGLELKELRNAETCCGFGGSFSVKMPHISEGMLADKVAAVQESGAGMLVSCDMSCLMHIGGALRRRDPGVRVRHLAQVLDGDAG